MIYEYLNEKSAVGAGNTVSTAEIMAVFRLTRRGVVRLVANERKDGRLICSSSAAGGYFLPASDAEIIAQKKRLEKTFISRANAVRVFRRACKAIKERAAGSDGEQEAARP